MEGVSAWEIRAWGRGGGKGRGEEVRGRAVGKEGQIEGVPCSREASAKCRASARGGGKGIHEEGVERGKGRVPSSRPSICKRRKGMGVCKGKRRGSDRLNGVCGKLGRRCASWNAGRAGGGACMRASWLRPGRGGRDADEGVAALSWSVLAGVRVEGGRVVAVPPETFGWPRRGRSRPPRCEGSRLSAHRRL